ncbi:MAG: ABC transporter permease, partial [Acidobacteriota bacterium]|nr:ABC transporter permease [Acidobacteriota bacterium]
SKKRAEGVGFDILFRPKNTSLMSSFNGAPMPSAFVSQLAKEPHVVATTGVVTQLVSGAFDTVTGIDEASFEHLSGPFIFLEGHGLRGPDDMLLDRYYADQRQVHAGQKLRVLNRDWNVAGVVEPGKMAHLFVPLQTLQDLISSTGKVSQIYIKLDDARHTPMVMEYLKSKYDYPVYSIRDLESAYTVDNIPLLKAFTDAVMWIGVLIGFAVVSLSMYMAVLQRTREIGILKSLGASKVFVMGIILAEALVLGVGGTIAGIGLSFVSRAVMNSAMGASLPQAIVPAWWPRAGLIAVGGALLGALYPGMLAVRQDPIEALAYE